ncbi:MAG TPA: MmpS family transport accessory protein [Caulobacteraceae bacterium]
MPVAATTTPPKAKTKAAPVALAIGGVALAMTLAAPRFLVTLPLLAAAACSIISMVRNEKWRPGAILVLVGCGLMFLWAASGTTASYAGKDVTYTVSGSATSADITYQNEGGGTSQEKVSLPWTQVIHSPSSSFLYISAQNQGEYGDITCEIKVGDTVVKTSNSSGSYSIASCSS